MKEKHIPMGNAEIRKLVDNFKKLCDREDLKQMREELHQSNVTLEEAREQIHRIHIIPERAKLKAREDAGMTGRPPDYGKEDL